MLSIDPNAKLHHAVGIGFKSQYLKDVLKENEEIGWLEIHAENYMMAGGPRKQIISALAERYPISCHGVGLSIGAETGLDADHIERLKKLVSWLNPALFSEHLAWSSHNLGYFNDLLPLPYTQAVLERVCRHIDQIQDALGRQMLLENPSTYVTFSENEMSEIEFIRSVASRTGCGLLLDVNNVFVSATNQKYDPYDYINAYPLEHVGEIHLGGHDEDADETGAPLLIDSHNNPVTNPVWKLYQHTLSKTGLRPTLIEWDQDLPSWDVLANEARRAATLMAAQSRAEHQAEAHHAFA